MGQMCDSNETLVSFRRQRCLRFPAISGPSGLQFSRSMSFKSDHRESPLARLAELNGALEALIAQADATDNVSPDAGRDLAGTIERLLGTIADLRKNPASNTPERLHALADALTALLGDIAGSADPPREYR